MQLIELRVFKNRQLLRSVPFKKGLNLILNTRSNSELSGNSVGKSTPSRLLDYLFLSSGSDIYTAPEFSKGIPEVVEFIESNDLLVSLTFNGFDNKPREISRTLTTDPKSSIYYINDKVVEKKEYSTLVSTHIFGQKAEKPSIRTLSHKFIRNTNEKMQNTTKFLHSTTRPDVYDQLYLYLFGFSGLDLLKEKGELNNQVKTKSKHLAAYRQPHRESALAKMIKPLRKEESEVEKKINNFDFKGSQESSVKELVKIQSKISELTIDYSKLSTRVEYLNNSIIKLKNNTASMNGRELSTIYSDAGVAISGDLKRSFEELVVFHNKVVANKISLISSDSERANLLASKVRGEIDALHEQEGSVFKDIKEPNTLKSIGQAYNNLSKIREKISGIDALLSKIEDTKSLIEVLEGKKKTIVDKILANTSTLDENVEIFNSYFGDLSKFFYDERYIFDLEFDPELEKCRFDIACISPNSTGGKKKGELSAFDLAYIDFVHESKLKRPTFVVHDSIEDVDVNQVFDIFEQANKVDGQYIVAVLSDKISESRFAALRQDCKILELSETDKFFKI